MNDEIEMELTQRTIDSAEAACRNLLCTVISTAIEDSRRMGTAGVRLASQARSWIESSDSSFQDLCGMLGLNASRIRSEALSRRGESARLRRAPGGHDGQTLARADFSRNSTRPSGKLAEGRMDGVR